MKKIKVLGILVSLIAICSIATIVAAMKIPFNQKNIEINNQINSEIEKITNKSPNDKIEVPDKSSIE